MHEERPRVDLNVAFPVAVRGPGSPDEIPNLAEKFRSPGVAAAGAEGGGQHGCDRVRGTQLAIGWPVSIIMAFIMQYLYK
jgi:hypothetical protein